MLSEDEIYQKVVAVMAEEFELNRDELGTEAKLYEELGLDSLDSVDMVVALEKAFGTKMSQEEELREIRTIGDICRLIERLQMIKTG